MNINRSLNDAVWGSFPGGRASGPTKWMWNGVCGKRYASCSQMYGGNDASARAPTIYKLTVSERISVTPSFATSFLGYKIVRSAVYSYRHEHFLFSPYGIR